MKKILVLGATGSIGSSTLDIARNMKDDFKIVGISANKSKSKAEQIKNEFGCEATLFSDDGIDGIKKIIDKTKPDIVVNGISGSAGLEPSCIVLENSIDLALANKETVVMAWPLIKSLAEKKGAKIIPVDSEHSAVFLRPICHSVCVLLKQLCSIPFRIKKITAVFRFCIFF